MVEKKCKKVPNTYLTFLLQVLINRLEKNRGMKPEERANIMKTLKELTEKISQLKNEISPTAQSTANTAQSKSKTDVRQFTKKEILLSHYRL